MELSSGLESGSGAVVMFLEKLYNQFKACSRRVNSEVSELIEISKCNMVKVYLNIALI